MTADNAFGWIAAEWPAPDNIVAGTTTRTGGVSEGAFASLNLGAHVDDSDEAVSENRRRLRAHLSLPQEPLWLQQVHGTRVARSVDDAREPADAAVGSGALNTLAIMTADCLPVLFCSRDGRHIAAAHGGWRGLADGILEQTVSAMAAPPEALIAWLGPAIAQPAFEVGGEVRDAFVRLNDALSNCFEENARGRWQADLYGIARWQLAAVGVGDVFGGDFCTYSDADRFYSYRRDAACGRMASIIGRRP
ncbi:MAG: peptidoglycan editing factor PgeF [Woeseiaceae bacterium]|nr:peptidoglycan editing factor PgeF [Woeseiaceae bacterium]